MFRLSMNEITTFSWTFDEDVHEYQEAGYEGIGVWRPKLTDFGEERGIELLAESGLHVSNLLWAGGFTGSEGRSFRDSVEDAIEAIHLAAAMNADCLVVYSGPRAGHTCNHARRLTRRALKELVAVAAAARSRWPWNRCTKPATVSGPSCTIRRHARIPRVARFHQGQIRL